MPRSVLFSCSSEVKKTKEEVVRHEGFVRVDVMDKLNSIQEADFEEAKLITQAPAVETKDEKAAE
jgi:hypothetical protein